jgi:hypothetical protein
MRSHTARVMESDNGSILVVTLLILFAVVVIGSTLAMVSSMDLKIAGNQRVTAQALPVAEAGLNEAIQRIAIKNPTIMTVGGWTGNVAIGDSKPYNPNWEVRLYLTGPGSAPAGSGNIVTTGTIQDPSQPYLQYSTANGGNGLLTIRHKWVDRDGDGVRDPDEIVRYDPAVVPPENFASGFPVEIVTVTGRRAMGERTIQAEVTKRTLLARTLGAIYSDHAVDITGDPSICGYNHDVNTAVGTTPNACFGDHMATGNLPGITTTGDDVHISGAAADVLGDPAPTDSASTNPWYTLAEVLGLSQGEIDQILANADNTTITNPFDGITYIDGDANIMSNTVGSGLLYVTGDLMAAGTFIFKGLIYVEGDLQFTGTPWILGTMIVKGTADYTFSAGNAAVLYSKDAIQQYVGQAMPAIVLSWREL